MNHLLSLLKKSLCVIEPSEWNDLNIYVDEEKLTDDELNEILRFVKPENRREF